MRALLAVLVALSFSHVAAQSWPTTTWHVVSEDGSALSGPRVAHGQTFGAMLEGGSQWFRAMGYRAPDMERSPQRPGAFLARVKDDPVDSGSGNVWMPNRSPKNQMFLTGNLGMTSPSTPAERLLWASPVHEVFHAVQWSYPTYAGSRAGARALASCGTGSDANVGGWFSEGSASALQVRWIEKEKGQPYPHHYRDASRGSWMRYFDQPLHEPRLPSSHFVTSWRDGERAAGRSWLCGYGTWYFWYAAGEMLAKEGGQESEYLRYVLEAPGTWADGGLEVADAGLRAAAEAYGSASRYDEGLSELYPEFIAQYVDDERFYESPEAIALRGRSEVKWHDGVIEPLAAEAFEVRIDVDDNTSRDRPARFRVTLDPQANRDHLHLIEGQRTYERPLADADPYQVEVPIYRDTTLLVRLANVAPEASETEGTQYSIRFELGGFYGAPAAGPYTAPDVDIPPGFSVMSGPPVLVGCSGGAEGGSVFDLVTAAEAVADVRRLFGDAERDLEQLDEALDDSQMPILPGMENMSEAQRRAIIEGLERQNPEALAQMRARISSAQAKVADGRQTDEPRVLAETSARYAGRSRVIATLVGSTGGKTCQLIVTATLSGEEGGAQQLSVADDAGYDGDGPMPVGIDHVGYFVGTVQDQVRETRGFEVCMMSQREQERQRRSICPTLCSGGQLSLGEASQGHIKGTLRVDLIRSNPDQSDGKGCLIPDRRELVVGFNVTSANQGQDAETLRGMSDETFRMLGLSQYMIDTMRNFTSGGGLVR